MCLIAVPKVGIVGSLFSSASAIRMSHLPSNTVITGTYTAATSTLTATLPAYTTALSAYSVLRSTLYVYNQNENVGTSRTAFTYVWKPIVRSMSPLSGSYNGGTVISIRGEYFFNTDLLRCYLGDTECTAAFVSVNEVKCTTKAVASTVQSGVIALTFDGFSNLTFTNSTGDVQRF